MHPGTIFDHFVLGQSHQPQLHPFSTRQCSMSCLAGRINAVQSEMWLFPASPRPAPSHSVLAEQLLHTLNNAHPQVCCIPTTGPFPGGICSKLVVSNTISGIYQCHHQPPNSLAQAEKNGSPRQKCRERKQCVGFRQFLTFFLACPGLSWCFTQFMCLVLSVCNVLSIDLLLVSAAGCSCTVKSISGDTSFIFLHASCAYKEFLQYGKR